MSVTSLAEAREKRQPHESGTARCAGCEHEWQYVAPYPTPRNLECPNCGDVKGRRRGLYMPSEDESYWECNCGNDRFMVLLNELLCEVCGARSDKNDA